MAQDEFEDLPQIEKPRGHGGLVIAGVVGACVLGGGLGLWARPAADESSLSRLAPPAAAPEEQAAGRLQIVIDDKPAPVGIPLEVLPNQDRPAGSSAGARALAPAEPEPVEPVAPRRAPLGLMKVDTVIAPEPPRVVRAVAAAEVEPPAPPVRKEAPKPRVEKAVAREAPPPKPKVQKAAARNEKPQAAPAPTRAERSERVAKAEPARRKETQVAKAEAPRKPAAQAEKQPTARQLANLARATRERLRAEIQAEIRLAEARQAKAARIAAAKQAAAKEAAAREVAAKDKARRERAAVLKASASRPATPKAAHPQPKPPVRGEGPLRMVKNTCVSSDPGEAIVCADPRLSVRERQMQQAYHQAEAAGVPPAQLRRQQQRWLAARAAAAREAPWAVEEVYEARIAELNDQSRASVPNDD